MLQPTQRRDGVTSVDRTVSCNATVWIVTVVLVLAAVPASPARAQQPTPPPQAEAIGKVIDKEMHRIRAAVASGDEEKVRACLKRLFPALAEQKQATIQPYVDAARGQQVRGGKKGLLWSLMQTCGYSGYVSDGLNLMTLGNIGAIDGTLDGTLGHLGNLGLLLSMYDCYDKASRGKLDDNTRTATMLAVYAKIASHYLKRYGNAFGAAAMTGYNLGMWARTWQLSSSQAKLMEGLNDYWHDRARQLGGWRTMWTDMWDRGGTAEVMKQLQQAGYWNEVDATKIYTGWSQQTWNGNYKAIFGERYFNKYVAKILANHVRRLAEKERGEAIEKIQRFIREFPQRELTIVTTLRVVDDAGNRSPVDAERVVVGLYCQNRKLLDLPYGTQQISVKTNLRAYSQAIAKAAGDFQVVAFYRCRNDSPRVAPDALTVGDLDYDEATGLCRALSDPWGFCFWSRLRFSSKGVAAEPFRVGRGGDRLSGFGNYAWLGPIRFNVFILPVQIRVVTAKGQPAADVSLTGPCGSATTDKQGRAQLMVTAASQSLVGVKHNGKATGDWVILTPAEVFKDPQAVHTIKLSDDPPVPKLDKYGSAQARRQAKDTAAAFAAGKVTFGSASKRLQRSGRLAEAAQANATNTWGVYEVVQLARINRRYEPKPDMSAQARATAAQAKRKAIEKLKARRESYLQPFADLEQQQEQASSKLAIQAMKRDKSIRRIMDDGRAAAKPVREVTARAGTRMKRLDSLLTMSYQRTEPRSFETLAEVQNYRKGVQALRTEIEPMTGQLGEDRRQLDRRLTALTNTLGSIVDPMEQGVGLVDVWAFRAEMGLLLAGAQGVLRAIAGELDSGKPDMAALGLRIADERLGGVQIQAAKNQKLMKAYDALLDAAPLRLRNNARRTRNLKALVGAFDEINKAIAFARSRGRWSYHLQIASGQEKQAWRQAGHNGFGVEAHSRWLEAEAIWKRLVTMQQILRQQRKIEAWLKDLDAKRETMARRRAAMRKSGWFIAEIDDALARRQRRPQQANALAELLRQARQIEKTRAGFSKIQADSVLHGAIQKFSFDDLLAASTTYGKAMAAAVAAARQGDRAKALAARRDAEKAIAAFTYQRGIGFDVGGRYATATLGTDWELVC
ncbi:MAG: hypothetical protein KGY81_02885, partial [Phycisphaerae bacterium]|nr:hypothetical protein [Phycisphaerae bacterium]